MKFFMGCFFENFPLYSDTVSDGEGPVSVCLFQTYSVPVNMEAKAGFHLENCSVGQNILWWLIVYLHSYFNFKVIQINPVWYKHTEEYFLIRIQTVEGNI